MKRTLSELAVGQGGRVAEVSGEGALKRRLIDMGLTPGTLVTVRGAAPSGDPIQVELRGYELSLRRQDARRVLVEVQRGRLG